MESEGAFPLLNVFTSPGFWTALLALLGVVFGAILARFTSKDELKVKKLIANNEEDRQDFEALHSTVGILQSELSRISNDVTELRKEVSDLRMSNRKLSEKYSSSIAYINILRLSGRELRTRLDTMNIEHGQLPEPPDNLVEDIKS